MPTLNIEKGMTLTTPKSGVKGEVQEIVENASGSLRVRLKLENGDTRWTTIK